MMAQSNGVTYSIIDGLKSSLLLTYIQCSNPVETKEQAWFIGIKST